MTSTTVGALDETVQKSQCWLKELTEIGHFQDEAQAYHAMRAVLHALRDRLTVAETAHLASELPMLVRGFYYEGWKPSRSPRKDRTRQQFVDHVIQGLRGGEHIDPVHAIQCVFTLLERKISSGEIRDVQRMLPEEIRELWGSS